MPALNDDEPDFAEQDQDIQDIDEMVAGSDEMVAESDGKEVESDGNEDESDFDVPPPPPLPENQNSPELKRRRTNIITSKSEFGTFYGEVEAGEGKSIIESPKSPNQNNFEDEILCEEEIEGVPEVTGTDAAL